MTEYIERTAVEEMLENAQTISDGEYCGYCTEDVNLNAIPAADVMEVRHGRWVDGNKNPIPWDEYNSKCPSHSAYCSECGEWLTASDEYPVTGLYCPNCGAKMEGGNSK